MEKANEVSALNDVVSMIDGVEGVPEPEKTIAKMVALMGGNPTNILIAGAYRLETAVAEKKYPAKSIPEDYTETERILHEMLIENTGCHPLDSGGVYGRWWERNRGVTDFRKLPVVEVDEDLITINVFHYLRAFLDRDDTARLLESLLYEFADRPENRDLSWFEVMSEFADQLSDLGWRVEGRFNSYNWDNLLSQVIQGITISRCSDSGEDRATYVILQIHNGCDVRGGYTAPRVFRIVEEEEGDFFFAMDELDASCGCTSRFTDDCGLHWWSCDGDGENGFPTYWKWNRKKRAWICEKCGKVVQFYNYHLE